MMNLSTKLVAKIGQLQCYMRAADDMLIGEDVLHVVFKLLSTWDACLMDKPLFHLYRIE